MKSKKEGRSDKSRVFVTPPPRGSVTDENEDRVGPSTEDTDREMGPRVEIHYCTRCRFLPRAAWMAQELSITFEDTIGEVVLRPTTGGVFSVVLDGEVIFSRDIEGRFPESKELKQRIRDRIAPGKDLGHSEE